MEYRAELRGASFKLIVPPGGARNILYLRHVHMNYKACLFTKTLFRTYANRFGRIYDVTYLYSLSAKITT